MTRPTEQSGAREVRNYANIVPNVSDVSDVPNGRKVRRVRKVPTVRRVLLSDDILGGHTISLAEFTDGRFGVYVDDAVVAATVWEEGELELSINDYLASKWELKHRESRARAATASSAESPGSSGT